MNNILTTVNYPNVYAGKKLMVLGGSYSQVPLIKTAKAMGCETIVAGLPGNYPGFEEADVKCFVDITKPADVYESAVKYQVDGIVTCCMDTGIESLGYACERMGLKGLNESSAKKAKNKLIMKEAFLSYGVKSAAFQKISNIEELKDVINIFGLPLIIKAVDLQGSLGVCVVRTREEAEISFHKVMRETRETFCIVEEFIEGYEFGVQAYVQNERLLYFLPHGDMTYGSDAAVPIGHSVPFEADKDIIEQARTQVMLAISAIGLDNCAVNVDLIVRDGIVYVIELTGRIGATCLSELVSIYYGINIYEMIVTTAVGGDASHIFKNGTTEPVASVAQILLLEQSGVVKRIVNNNVTNQNIVDISFNIDVGSNVNKFAHARDRIGQIIVKGGTIEECNSLLKNVIDNIRIELE